MFVSFCRIHKHILYLVDNPDCKNIKLEGLEINTVIYILKIPFFSVFSDWLEFWDTISSRNGKLTKGILTAKQNTAYVFLELTKYCIEELKMPYILSEKF